MLDPHGFVATCNSTNFLCVRGGEVWAPTTKYQARRSAGPAVSTLARSRPSTRQPLYALAPDSRSRSLRLERECPFTRCCRSPISYSFPAAPAPSSRRCRGSRGRTSFACAGSSGSPCARATSRSRRCTAPTRRWSRGPSLGCSRWCGPTPILFANSPARLPAHRAR